MKTTVNFSSFVDAFNAHGRGDNFSYDGLRVLFDYIEELEEGIGEEIEMDVVALCCDYSEYSVSEAIEYFEVSADDLGLADELADYREAVVEERMGAVNERLDEDMEAALREQYEEEAQTLKFEDLFSEEVPMVKAALLEYFGERSQVIDIPHTERFILLAY